MDFNQTLKEYRQFKMHNEGLSERSVIQYATALRKLNNYLTSRVIAIEEASLNDLMYFTGMHLHGLNIPPSHRRVAVAAVRSFYQWLHHFKGLKSNPSERLPYPYAGRPLPKPFGLNNAEKILMQPDINTFVGLRDVTILATLIGTGMRVSGLVGLNESSLIFSQEKDHERLFIHVVEKGSAEREVPAPMELWAFMRAYLGHERLEDIDRTLKNGDKLLFTSVTNRRVTACDYRGEKRRLTPTAVWQIVRKYGRQARIPDDELHPHAFRHLYGQQLAEAEVPDSIRMDLMGHRSRESSQIYAHIARNLKQKNVDKSNPLGRITTPVTALIKRI